MHYYKAQCYSPSLGRFLQTDPVGYQDDLNLYAYVKNDPLDGLDPTGNDDSPWSMSQADARVREIHQTDPVFAAKADTALAGAVVATACVVGCPAAALWALATLLRLQLWLSVGLKPRQDPLLDQAIRR